MLNGHKFTNEFAHQLVVTTQESSENSFYSNQVIVHSTSREFLSSPIFLLHVGVLL